MNKLIRLYNQNRKLIIAIIGIIALIIIVIQVLNGIAEKQNEAKAKNIINNVNSSTDLQSTTISQSNVSSLTGDKVQNDKKNTDIIKQFVKYCNEGQIEKAYNMLTDECKTLLYPSLERFKTSYYDRIFNIDRMYTLKNWYTTSLFDTYYIKYTEDVLASGNVQSKNNLSDYITIVNNKSDKCLNINSYVGSTQVNSKKNINGVTIKIDKIYMYMDYTILNIKVKNGTNNTISIDTKEDTEATYIYDTNKIRYTAFLNENSEAELQIRRNMEVGINIKFNKLYNPERRDILGLCLKDVVLNYDNYAQGIEEKKQISFDIEI